MMNAFIQALLLSAPLGTCISGPTYQKDLSGIKKVDQTVLMHKQSQGPTTHL